MKNNKFILILILILSSCGGGTAGTSNTDSVGRLFQGHASDARGSALANTKVSINSSDTSTDSNGFFSLQADAPVSAVVSIENDNNILTSETPVDPDSGVIDLELGVDSVLRVSSAEMGAIVRGECAKNVVYQADQIIAEISDSTECLVEYFFKTEIIIGETAGLNLNSRSCAGVTIDNSAGIGLEGNRLLVTQKYDLRSAPDNCRLIANFERTFPNQAPRKLAIAINFVKK
jgi:hypothetical protein